MKSLIDWFLIFTLMFVLHGIAVRFLFQLERKSMWELDVELYMKDLGILFFHPENRG